MRITKPVEERRQEIIDTASKLFFEKGFDNTQVADISKEMNIAQGLVYHYFKSKTEILYAVIDRFSETHASSTMKALSEFEGTAIECLQLVFGQEPDVGSHKKMFESIMRDEGIIEYCSKKMTDSTMPVLLALIERGNADGSWQCAYPKETAAFVLQGIGGLFGPTHAHEAKDNKKAFTNIIRRLLCLSPLNDNLFEGENGQC